MYITITGGRELHFSPHQRSEFLRLIDGNVHVNGGARGIDHNAYILSASRPETINGYVSGTILMEAQWGKFGKAAGMIRNAEMLKLSDALIVCDGGRGTMNCFGRALKVGVPVIDFRGLNRERQPIELPYGPARPRPKGILKVSRDPWL